MKDFLKGILVTVLVLVYFISPVDFCPGLLDDIAVIILGIMGTVGKRLEA